MAKGDVLVRMKADVGNYNANLASARKTLQNFKSENLSLGGIVKNVTRSFTAYAAGLASIGAIAGKLHETVTEAVALAKAGEGVRIAFNRLNDPYLLNGLREATHGTVADVELMKAAVKFNDFKLPLDELGTMLAFAQQKAKDTGQSVDYMVDSIVTGLGRKSLMILDNLGLSASEVKEKMAETGDMTKAVGAIIREQMAKAGDYVETAADRAAQATVSLQNKMEELGRKFGPVEEASSQLWTSMKIGILDIIGGPLAQLLNSLTEAGRLKNALNNMNGVDGSGNTKVDQQLKTLQAIRKAGGSNYMFNSTLNGMMEDYNRQIMALDAKIKDTKKLSPDQQASKFVRDEVQKMREQMKALGMMRDQLAAGVKDITNPKPASTTVPGTTTPVTKSATTTTNVFAADSIAAQEALVQKLTKAYKEAGAAVRDEYKARLDEAKMVLDNMTGAVPQLNMGHVDTMASPVAGLKPNLDIGTKQYSELSALTDQLNSLTEAQATFGQTSSVAWQMFQNEIDNVTQKIEEFKGKGLDKAADASSRSFSTAASAIGAVGSALNSIEDPGAKVFSIVAQAIATVAQAHAQAIATDKSTKGNIWAFIGAAAATTVSLITMIQQIHNSTGYANGGVIQGNSFSGDNQIARVNAGETILTRAQSGIVDSLLNNRINGGAAEMQPYVDTEKIFLGMTNRLKRNGQGEIVTTSTLRKYGLIN